MAGARHETEAIAAVFELPKNSSDILLGAAASEFTIKSTDLSRYRFLHFATHGALAEDLPYLKQPALVLSQVGDLKGEDGFLTRDEVLKLKLDAELTVLSACETGLGDDVSGEGVVGLARSFLLAGSRSVIVSLWKVDDEATALLMTRFYELVKQGSAHANALQQAKQYVRQYDKKNFQDPFFWAGFVLYGPA